MIVSVVCKTEDIKEETICLLKERFIHDNVLVIDTDDFDSTITTKKAIFVGSKEVEIKNIINKKFFISSKKDIIKPIDNLEIINKISKMINPEYIKDSEKPVVFDFSFMKTINTCNINKKFKEFDDYVSSKMNGFTEDVDIFTLVFDKFKTDITDSVGSDLKLFAEYGVNKGYTMLYFEYYMGIITDYITNNH